jgi:hypothetical protein
MLPQEKIAKQKVLSFLLSSVKRERRRASHSRRWALDFFVGLDRAEGFTEDVFTPLTTVTTPPSADFSSVIMDGKGTKLGRLENTSCWNCCGNSAKTQWMQSISGSFVCWGSRRNFSLYQWHMWGRLEFLKLQLQGCIIVSLLLHLDAKLWNHLHQRFYRLHRIRII